MVKGNFSGTRNSKVATTVTQKTLIDPHIGQYVTNGSVRGKVGGDNLWKEISKQSLSVSTTPTKGWIHQNLYVVIYCECTSLIIGLGLSDWRDYRVRLSLECFLWFHSDRGCVLCGFPL